MSINAVILRRVLRSEHDVEVRKHHAQIVVSGPFYIREYWGEGSG